jgi:ADP-ribose pyrophosphatase
MPDARPNLLLTEVVAGIVEAGDRGEEGIRRRAALEVAEEAGYRVSAADIAFLGASTFPVPGTMAEKWWLTAVEVRDPADQIGCTGDGSPMEEGAVTSWMEIDQAIAACVAGAVEDAKTELILRRLRDTLKKES